MSNPYLKFDLETPELQILLKWWHELNNHSGDRAELRRCGSLSEVMFNPSYHRLRISLMEVVPPHAESLALLVGLAVLVKDIHGGLSIASQMSVGGEEAVVSDLRFRRLLKIKTREDLFLPMRRIIALLGGAVNMQSLARSMYQWNDFIRKEWAFDYYTPKKQNPNQSNTSTNGVS